MAPESHRDFGWLQEVILMAVRDPATWESQYAEYIGKRENITRERIRQILHKAVWNNWKADSVEVIKNHFGADVQMNFECVKPNHMEFIGLMAENLCEKYYYLMEKEELGYMNPFNGEFVYYTSEEIEKNNCETLFKDKLYGEIWREIPCDFEQAAHYGEEALERLKKADKDVSAALEYLPTYVKALYGAYGETWLNLISATSDMTIADFSPSDLERFTEGWIDAMEQCGIDEYMLLHFYLLGQYLYNPNLPAVVARSKKDFARALEKLPKLLFTSKIRDYDLELQKLVYGMRKVGYSEAEITVFATRYITELSDIIEAEGWYSEMHMQLFGEHMSGARVDIPGLGDFEKAIEILPRYVNFIVRFDKAPDEHTNRFDSDAVLYALIENMRKHDFSKEQVSRFASEWMNAMEKTDNVCYMRMYAYLFDEFAHETFLPENNYNLVYDITPLFGLKNFERALAFVPKWMEYLNDDVQYFFGHTPESCVPEVIEKMHEYGYTDTEIEKFSASVVDTGFHW